MKWRIVPTDYIESLKQRATDAEAKADAILDRMLMHGGALPLDPKLRAEVAQVDTLMETIFNELGENERDTN